MVKQYQRLTDSQWQVIAPFLPVQRKRKLCLRQVFDALRWVCRVGNQWRMLGPDFPPWTAVAYYFYEWQRSGLLERLNTALVEADRVRRGRKRKAAWACVDSQSVKLAPQIGEHRGKDGFKKVNGRKRQIITDMLGNVLAVRVHAANVHDTVGGQGLLGQRATRPAWAGGLKLLLADRGYRGQFAARAQALGLKCHFAGLPKGGFVPLPGRWVVERTFAWFNFFRRLVIDFEHTPESHQAWILIANISMCLNRVD